MERKYDIITALDINVDFLVMIGDQVPEFGQKEKSAEDYMVEMGGSCNIFASQAAKLNLKTAGMGVAGNDAFGELIINKLRQSGVILDHIRVDERQKTGVSMIICRKDDRAILTYPGTIDAVCYEDFTDEIIKSARHLHIGSYFLMKRLQPYYKDIARRAKEYGLTVSLDTNWDPDEKWDGGIWDLIPYMDIFLPNENEAMAITKKDNAADAIKILSEKVPVVAVKLGKRGAAAYHEGKEYHAAPVEVKVVDTVGAGDSFDAGFIYGFLAGYDVRKCLQIGCICGSMNTTKAGGIAGQPRLDVLLKMLLFYTEEV